MRIEDFGGKKKKKGKGKKGKKGKKKKDKKRKAKSKYDKEFNWSTKRIAAAILQEILVDLDVLGFGMDGNRLQELDDGSEVIAVASWWWQSTLIEKKFHHRKGWATEARMEEIRDFIDKVLASFHTKLIGITHA